MFVLILFDFIITISLILLAWKTFSPITYYYVFSFSWIKRRKRKMTKKEIITKLEALEKDIKENYVSREDLHTFILIRDYLIKTDKVGKIKNAKLKKELLDRVDYRNFVTDVMNGNVDFAYRVKMILDFYEEKQELLDKYAKTNKKEKK